MQGVSSQPNVPSLPKGRQPEGEDSAVIAYLFIYLENSLNCATKKHLWSEEQLQSKSGYGNHIHYKKEIAQYMDKVHVISDLIPILK
jgi:hypothetical protein